MDRIYLDNAATTPLDEEVLAAMMPYLTEKFGNPSSIYHYGRETKIAIEQARKAVAQILGCTPSEIFFTSGGTEATNTILNGAVYDLGCERIITSPLEHHATLHTVECLAKKGAIELVYVDLLEDGHINLAHLESLLSSSPKKTLISLMHANNEVGNILDIQKVAALAEKYQAYFHSDTVQTVGHFNINLAEVPVHFINAAGHKFHGPKGVGVLFIRSGIQISPIIHGGSQERNMRAGTENIYGIVGFAKALELAVANLEKDQQHIQGLKTYMAEQLQQQFPQVRFNGDYKGRSLYTVLNVGFPKNEKTDMLLYALDIAGVCVSGGSACSSGTNKGSHVISHILKDEAAQWVPIRFSFSKQSTKSDIDKTIDILKDLI